MKIETPRLILTLTTFLSLAIFLNLKPLNAQCIGDVPLPNSGAKLPISALNDLSKEAGKVFSQIPPLNLPIVGGLLKPITGKLGGGFLPSLAKILPVSTYLTGIEQSLSGIRICEIEELLKKKPKDKDIEKHWQKNLGRVNEAQSLIDKNMLDPDKVKAWVSEELPNKGGAAIAEVVERYVNATLEQFEAIVFPNQFSEPMNMVWPDPEIGCKMVLELPFIGCGFVVNACIPIGASYNYPTNVYNIHPPGHPALLPKELVQVANQAIMQFEQQGNLPPFIVSLLNKADLYDYWASQDPKLNNVQAALFLAQQDEITQQAIQQAFQVQELSGLLMPPGDINAFDVTGVPSLFHAGIPGLGALPVSKKSSFILSFGGKFVLPTDPFVKTQYDSFARGYISAPGTDPRLYFHARSTVPSMVGLDPGYDKLIKNLNTFNGSAALSIAQSQEQCKEGDKNCYWETSSLYENIGGGFMQDENAPGPDKKQLPSTNPQSGNGCRLFRPDTIFHEPTFASIMAQHFCEVEQAIVAEQLNCPYGPGRCSGPRSSYVPYDHGKPGDYSRFPDPEGEHNYSKYLLPGFGGEKKWYHGSLPSEIYPPNSDQVREWETPMMVHFSRQRDCPDINVARQMGLPVCDWVRCNGGEYNDLAHFEPAAPGCMATDRFRPDRKVPERGCDVS